MEGGGNGMSGGIMPASLGSGMLDLEMQPLRHQRVHPHHQQQQFFPFPDKLPHEIEHSPSLLLQQQQEEELRHGSSYGGRGKQQPLTLSSEEEHTFVGEEAVAPTDGRAKQKISQPAALASSSPWQRMRWTDGMVRLLIMVVYCVGDDGNEGGDQPSSAAAVAGTGAVVLKGKKTSGASSSSSSAAAAQAGGVGGASAGLLLQKKGKWKSVSRAMMEKGFSVSPQQCEDKFNDLNKRYKRVNDLLGKGTACRVVENQALLDTMDHLSPKAKEEARKLLNSKHLFFREMCAYHNSQGGGGGGGGTGTLPSSLAVAGPPPPPQLQPQPDQQQQQMQCSHHPLDSSHGVRGGEAVFASKGGHIGGSSSMVARDSKDNINDEADEDDREDDADTDEDVDDDDDYDDEDDLDDDQGNILNHHNNNNNKHPYHHQITLKKKHCRDDEDYKKLTGTKRARTSLLLSASSISASPPLSLSLSASPTSTSMQQLRCEMLESLATSGGGEPQQRHWLRRKVAELEEQRLGYQYKALELEHQRLKWLRFSSNKEREMERMKLHHERLSLENDRMLLLLRHKDHELGSAPSMPPVKFASDHLQNSQLH